MLYPLYSKYPLTVSFWVAAPSALWIGTYNGGLKKFDPVHGSFTHYLHDPADSFSLAHNMVLWLCADPISPNVLWIGTGGGLSQFDQSTQRFANYRHVQNDSRSLSHNTIRALYADKSGTLWVGT